MTGTGAIRTVTLADGSTAVLDSRSAIAVDYRSGERRVTLLR
ncbi:FecR domain-containing protein, partial [Klebsiella pneumoniae]